jgi:hypothetical protein
MPVCNKCNIEKPLDQYFKEIKKSNGRTYYKKYCNDCFRKQSRDWKAKNKVKKNQVIELPQPKEIIQPVVLKLEPEVLVIPDGYKECDTCKITKTKIDFYHSQRGKAFKNCKECHVKHYKEKIVDKQKNNGGSERIINKPDTYVDRYQKEQTFWLMELLGWTYNDNGVWSKEGIKDKDKVWTNIKTKPKVKRYINYNGGRKILPVHNKIDEVIQKYNEGIDFYELAYIYGCSHTTIRKIINSHYDDKGSS